MMITTRSVLDVSPLSSCFSLLRQSVRAHLLAAATDEAQSWCRAYLGVVEDWLAAEHAATPYKDFKAEAAVHSVSQARGSLHGQPEEVYIEHSKQQQGEKTERDCKP
jgi:hypothetical protein